MNARHLMTPTPLTIPPTTTVGEALGLMRSHSVRHLPVCDESGLVGMISDRDLHDPLTAAAAGEEDLGHHLSRAVSMVMTYDVFIAYESTPAETVARAIIERRIGAVPVVDPSSGAVVGIISYVDVLVWTTEALESDLHAGLFPGTFKRVLVPMDFEDMSLAALRVALGSVGPAAVRVVHVISSLSAAAPAALLGDSDDVGRTRAVRKALAAKISSAGLDVPEIDIRVGAPGIQICDLAKDMGMNLIVIPSHGRTGLKRMVLGSIAELVVRHAPCPVLVLRGGLPDRWLRTG